MNSTAILMSIKPKYAELIFSGEKTIELRRVCPKLGAGDLVLVYVSGPRMALVGGFEVSEIVCGTPDAIYSQYGNTLGVNRPAFDTYFKGSSTAYGIVIARTWTFRKETELTTLRQKVKGFQPPQSYRYLKGKELAMLNGDK